MVIIRICLFSEGTEEEGEIEYKYEEQTLTGVQLICQTCTRCAMVYFFHYF